MANEYALHGKRVRCYIAFDKAYREGTLYRVLTDNSGRPIFEVVFGGEYGDHAWRLTSQDTCVPVAKPAYLSHEECLKRYPRICRLIQDVLIGSASEAACCLRDYRSGNDFGSEAVSHSGLTPFDRVYTAVNRWRQFRWTAPASYRRIVGREVTHG